MSINVAWPIYINKHYTLSLTPARKEINRVFKITSGLTENQQLEFSFKSSNCVFLSWQGLILFLITVSQSVYHTGVCFGPLGNHGNLPNCYGSLHIPEIIFHKPCLNSLQTYVWQPGRFVQRRALAGDELSFMSQGEPENTFSHPGNKQIFLSVLTWIICCLICI